MTPAEKLAQIAADLDPIDDPSERLSFVVDRARRNPPLAPAERTDAQRVPGCVSVVWLVGEIRAGRCQFRSDAESPVVRGLLALLCDVFSDALPADVAASALDPLATLGLSRHLSPTRLNGLASALARIRELARQAG